MTLGSDDSLYPIAVLIDELRNEDPALRLNSVRRLRTIALALGEERTRRELIPFLNENSDDEDEILLAMAAELGGFVSLVGGPEHAQVLLLPLETLATVDETVVRDRAAESLIAVASAMPVPALVEFFVPALQRLAGKEWTARVSATRLFTPTYARCPPEHRPDLLRAFLALTKDETPMVRRAAAQALGDFAQVVEPEPLSAELLPAFLQLTRDDQDSVRLIAVEACGPLAKVLPREAVYEHVLPVLQHFALDKSWRVRYNVAQQLPALAEVLGGEATRAELLPAFVRLLRDGEAEARAAAAARVATVARLLPAQEVLDQLLPPVKELAGDGNQYVRAALASVVLELAPVAATIEHLLPVFLSLLKDEWAEARLNIIGKLDQVNQVIGVDLLAQSLLPAIKELAEDRNWRVRLAIISHIPLLAGQLGADFFEQKLGQQCMRWLQDTVFSVREAATNNLRSLAQEFGADWAREHVLALAGHQNYLYRITVLAAVSSLAAVVPRDTLCNAMLPTVVERAKDRVPNVRFNAAQLLERLAGLVDPPVVDQVIKPVLAELAADRDADVRFFATHALAACDDLAAMA
ncbi:hypothetical protein APUTEX25_005167 [Auxenochlorella protothecoides]|uniref:Phosphatase PP2A regulatory subunit A/Splicing factor 3B subunit 1-like HEAT repeat domain-containing protein n=1 Tax=Auxenochlorella protothecoides TaxID=3075 RepID=A0A3M7KRM6_AUXPR|nr:hypothetical protein APUTEX25_005167 [Auxenochlorella protothecoides]|eukprot:RMZ53178.1 hypothetical protein APUTEX25_005167 [Auxenochlorella protothecoides]